MRTALLTACLLALFSAGCGNTVEPDPASKYTPDSLAQVLIFRARDMTPSARKTPKATTKKASPEEQTKAATTQTKKAFAATIDDVVDETVEKFSLVPGMTKSEVFSKVRAKVSADASLSEPVKKNLLEALDASNQEK
ncbi:hypothetical protein [Singulisphaera sp. PoT]|uniref:hypothetical protein n=1 Tax=Singulisphaera sp. PoT TaxID=3411797 RepID=UPI003BF56DD1